MKLLITGASGLYGSKLSELAVIKKHQVFSLYHEHLAAYGVPVQVDITNKEKVDAAIQRVEPDVVVHAATLTDVDKCEMNKDLAWRVNVQGTRNVAQAAKACNAFLLYISTDYVFDGEKGCYKETDQPSPISYYAYSKFKAEESIEEIATEFCISRPSVIYGANPAAGKVNFALWVLNKLRSGEEAKVFADQWNSPTLNTSLAEMTLEIAERKLRGVYHLSGASRISRFDFAQRLAETFNLNKSLLKPTPMRDFSLPAKRPVDSSLDTSKAERTLQHKPMKICEALEALKTEVSFSS